MEQLLHYCWKHRLFPLSNLLATDGSNIEIVDPGLHNDNAGPDFFNAKVKIDGQLWVGNIEIHCRASDWHAHRHDDDRAYDNVILHVCQHADTDITLHDGRRLAQMEVEVPPYVANNYRELLRTDHYPPCHRIMGDVPSLTTHAWMSALQTERLEQKTNAIRAEAERWNDDWEQTFFVTIARSFGFGINSDAFEQWARSLPLNIVAHQRDDRLMTEALFLGQAGMLDIDSMTAQQRREAEGDEHFGQLALEYAFMRHKYSLTPIDRKLWRYMRLRPQNFPQIRIVQLMHLYLDGRLSLQKLVEQHSADELMLLWQTETDGYWTTHYVFGRESRPTAKQLTTAALHTLIINAAIPMLFAYGRRQGNEALCDRAFDILENLPPENNNIVRLWAECGLTARNAGDTQALIQLKKQYCDRRDCLHCRIGYEYMRRYNATDLFG